MNDKMIIDELRERTSQKNFRRISLVMLFGLIFCLVFIILEIAACNKYAKENEINISSIIKVSEDALYSSEHVHALKSYYFANKLMIFACLLLGAWIGLIINFKKNRAILMILDSYEKN